MHAWNVQCSKSAAKWNAMRQKCNLAQCNAQKVQCALCNAGGLSAIYLITSQPLPAKAPTEGEGEGGMGGLTETAGSIFFDMHSCTLQYKTCKKWCKTLKYTLCGSCTLNSSGTNFKISQMQCIKYTNCTKCTSTLRKSSIPQNTTYDKFDK